MGLNIVVRKNIQKITSAQKEKDIQARDVLFACADRLFQKCIRQQQQGKNYFYVDKTDFICEWWENGAQVTLITRPRRFGKKIWIYL